MGARLPQESYEQYRDRMRQEQVRQRVSLLGETIEAGPAINRSRYRLIRERARKELAKARGRGYSDEEILAVLRGGDDAQRMYADFIEYELLKVG